MAKASPAFTNFTAGELSPRLDGRTDLSKYFNGCKTLQNFLVHPHGGATRRPGTEFISEVKDSTKNVRLIPFEFNVEQAYILEFGDEVFRVYKDGGVVVDGGGSPVEFTTPFAHTELDGLKFAQSADVMYIVHPNHPPQQITRTDHDAWTINAVEFRRGPLLDPAFDGSTLTASARTGSVTITASGSVFASTDVGRIIKLHDGYAEITDVHSQIDYTGLAGTFTDSETITGGTSGATATVIDDNGSTSMIIGAESAAFTVGETITGGSSAATATVGTYSANNSQSSVTADVLENEDLRTELMPSYTNTTISFHEGDPDATGLAHNDFIQCGDGEFIEEGFKVGMRVTVSGSSNNPISAISVSGSKIAVTTTNHHNLIDGDIITLTGITGLTVTSPSGGVNINGTEWQVNVTSDTQFELQDPATGLDASASGSAGVGSAFVVNGNNISNALIVQLTDDTMTLATSADLNVQNAGPSITIVGDLDPDDEYQLGAFSETTGYPACVSFFEQRLVFANTLNNPQTIFFSVAGDFTNFTGALMMMTRLYIQSDRTRSTSFGI